ncbi:hypothetical protein [Nitrospira moscoviensis]|uniref:SnoaL-like domain-containing protein n=1 Tax=Nitrospira moscoviensis TaxID=42253 RepID=A0A0K2G726_NITMO|nr:hypothetical protein [Nitrospira moscoviensis]ALA56664.1 hypothetical protein NITMOv2_0225 [Nitrospira moscoviensis]
MAIASIIVAVVIAYAVFDQRLAPGHRWVPFGTSGPAAPDLASDRPPAQKDADRRLTRESIEFLLDTLDQARRRKDADGLLRHLAPEAVITVHIKQGAQQQLVTLTREEYRTALNMGFAFPSANDYTRVSTHIALAPDERSAKVSLKSTETLRHRHRELKIEGEETWIIRMRGDKPLIVSLEQVVPGDST